MATIQKFSELLVWKHAHELALLVYRLSEGFPKHELFGLVSQARRCAVSVPSNIAEGFKRKSRNESIRFYNISEGSLEELKYQMLLAKDLKYISASEYSNALNKAEEVGRLLYGWKKVQK